MMIATTAFNLLTRRVGGSKINKTSGLHCNLLSLSHFLSLELSNLVQQPNGEILPEICEELRGIRPLGPMYMCPIEFVKVTPL